MPLFHSSPKESSAGVGGATSVEGANSRIGLTFTSLKFKVAPGFHFVTSLGFLGCVDKEDKSTVSLFILTWLKSNVCPGFQSCNTIQFPL